MISFNDFNKKIHNQEYEIVKSKSGLPMFVINNNPLIQDDDDDEEEDERELVGREVEVTITDFDVEDENDEPVRKTRSIPQQVQRVCDYITRHF